MKKLILLFLLLIPGVVLAQGLVEIVNTPLSVEQAAVTADRLRSQTFTVTPAGHMLSFNESVVLQDIGLLPVPPATRTISGICQVRFLINDVPVTMGGWSIAHVKKPKPLSPTPYGPPPRPPKEGDPPYGYVTTIAVTLPNIVLPRLPSTTIVLTPNDMVTVEVTPTPKEVDCVAEILVFATTPTPPPLTDGH